MTLSSANTLDDTRIHYATIERHTPHWLKTASAATLQAARDAQGRAPAWFEKACLAHPSVASALAEAHAEHRANEARVRALFEPLPDLETFATRQLSAGIKARFGLELDVANTYLVDARLIDTQRTPDARHAVDQATRSLLHCALHNFDADSATAGGMDAPQAPLKKSVVLDHRRFMGSVPLPNTLDISPDAFAGLCRSLDIGGTYHALLHAIYFPRTEPDQEPHAVDEAVYATLARAEASAFRQSLHLALLKGDIGQALYEAALATSLDAPLGSSDDAIGFSTLSLWGAELFGLTLLHLPAGQVALYKPDDGETPLKEYPSFDALKQALRDTLLANRAYLDNCLAERDKAVVLTKLEDRLAPFAWSSRGLWERVPAPSASLEPIPHAFKDSLLGGLVMRKVDRHERDALFHAVPTQVVDRRSAAQHRADVAAKVLTALNIAGFFVPGLGEAMLAVCIAQLGYEVYEGIESWAEDDKAQAHRYLMDVVENIATLTAWAAAGYVLKAGVGAVLEGNPQAPVREIPTVETPSFIEALEEVELPDGQRRLWQPDLAGFAHDTPLPADLVPDATGVYTHEGKRWLVLDDKVYAIKHDPAADRYRLAHPTKPLSYEPPLRHNGAGAWLHPLDRPLTWQGAALFRRLGPLGAALDEVTARRLLQVSGVDEAVLRRALSENQRMPAILEDTLQRFRLDQEVAQALPQAPAVARQLEFDQRYRPLSAGQASDAGVLQRVYPQMPASITDELLRNATPDELQALTAGKVPRRLAEESRAYQQQVRLTRAFEGLYLDAVRNTDTDRLVLNTLEQLEGWPADTVIELQQRIHSPGETYRCGPAQAPADATLISSAAGYRVLGDDAQAPLTLHDSLYAALAEVLPAPVRATLGDSDAALALRRRVQQAAPCSRATLRSLLQMQPVRPGYRSPMRLADGRLGYPLGGAGATGSNFTRHALLRMIRTLDLPGHTARSAEQILTGLENSGMNRADIQGRLQQLLEQRDTLQSRLDDWRASIAPEGPQALEALDALHATLTRHWHANALPGLDEQRSPLQLDQVDLSTFPPDLPEFFGAQVRHLRLIAPGFGNAASWVQYERQLLNLFRQFPELRTLEVSRPYDPANAPSAFLFAVGTLATHFPHLESLSLTNQNLALSGRDIESLSQLAHLRWLDLSGNRLSQRYQAAFAELSLDYLGLERMGLDQWPQGLGLNALSRIREVSLRDNAVRTLPGFLLSEERDAAPSTVISLQGNDILEEHLLRLLLNDESVPSRFSVDLPEALDVRLRHHLQQRQALRDAVDHWANASSSTAPLSQAAVIARTRIGTTLNTFWRNQELGMSQTVLRLENMALEDFPPQLPTFFHERVRNLSLARTSGSTQRLQAFLQRFPAVQSLTLVEHAPADQALPTVLLQLPRLTHLSLRDMGLVVDEGMLGVFAQLPDLVMLELAGNRLGDIAQAPEALRTLRRLDLNNMGIRQWPAWVDSLLPLDLLDLSENQLTELPPYILSNLDNDFPISSISLYDNPLSHDTMFRARTSSDSQRSYTFAMNLPEDLLLLTSSDDELNGGHLHNPILPAAGDEPQLDDWLRGSPAENEALRDAWQGLQQAGDAGNLLSLVGRLRQAAPYRNGQTRPAFCQRVRKVLVIAVAQTQERSLFNAIAEEALVQPDTGNQTCHDGALLVFQSIELLIDNRRLLSEHADSEGTLYQELRRLYRLHRLDEIARENARGRDEAEVRLAYRRGLNQELALGVPDDGMLYQAFADVSHNELALAMDRVQREERGEGFLDYATSNQAWGRYLRHAYAERFSALEQAYQAQVNALPERHPDRPIEALADEFKALEEEKLAQERRLIQELTIVANPDSSPLREGR
ncbi:NEL-type E3 ubiquitin ligase domain-containing protein [Pseudomonas entomophila]|uniref:dermonecrotic toxin domain-containing protein n=1 Tax=Pseudomonas entomophila TaxID=312306 RepID=UPI0023D854C4|nr:DUF6543 domain-containing protein [Pseudomonas entomophila]MDF0733977.1 NEL-type E3 ubiquitin ligase domain-containing protein [Pseudomonas entomophila]